MVDRWCAPPDRDANGIPGHRHRDQRVIPKGCDRAALSRADDHPPGSSMPPTVARGTPQLRTSARSRANSGPVNHDLETLRQAPVGIFRTDADGRCVFVNDRWCEFAGIPAHEALGHGWVQTIHPDDRDRVVDEWNAATTERRDSNIEFRCQRPDGTVTWVSGSATTLIEDDVIVGYVGTITDITDALTTRATLTAERRFVDTTIDIVGTLVCVFDPEGRFIRFNRACELLTGYTFDEIKGRPFYEFLVPPEEIDQVRRDLADLRPGAPPAANINHWITRDGAQRLISWSDACFFDDKGSLTHIVSTGIDITDERRAEDALRGIEAVGRVLAKQGPTTDAMAAVLQALSEGMGYAHLAIFLVDNGRLELSAKLGYAELPATLEAWRGIIGRVLRTGEPALVPDVSMDPDYLSASPDVTSEIAVPLVADGETVGVLNIESTNEAPLTQSDLRLAVTVAERLAVALVLGRDQQALADRARVFVALTDFARTANSTLEQERLLVPLLDAAHDVVPAEVVAITLLDRETGRYTLRAIRGMDPPGVIGSEIKPGEGAAGRAIASRTLVIHDMTAESAPASLRDRLRGLSLASLGVPLIREGAVLGAISLARFTDRRPAWSDLEREVLPLLAAQTALALANAQLLQEVQELAIRDGLTGLFNRRHFDATLEHLLQRRARNPSSAEPMAAIMFDLDHFGKFNKEHGHQAGDAVLRAFAGTLLGRLRASDLVGRYGGEEFVVVLEGATIEDAAAVAETIRAELETRQIAGHDGQMLRATVSAGCAALLDSAPTAEALIRATDVGLFMAKRAGRNQVVSV
jgi:diguanylate cyclase (GGDEF)-like protein/PAS domain S-box-containing protein